VEAVGWGLCGEDFGFGSWMVVFFLLLPVTLSPFLTEEVTT